MTLGIVGAVVIGEAGGEEQAARELRSKKLALSTAEVEEESLRMSNTFIWLENNLLRPII